MPWLQIVLMILKLLQQAKQHNSADSFVQATAPVGTNGEILKWLWEHRQEIVDFIKMFFKDPPVMGSTTTTEEIKTLVNDL